MTATDAVLRVRVVPRARTNALTVEPSGTLRVRLTAPPVEGAANRALLALLARELGLRRADLEILRGDHGREKLIAVRGSSAVALAARLARLEAGPR